MGNQLYSNIGYLKKKLSTILRSVKYTVINDTPRDLSHYLRTTSNGIINLLKKDMCKYKQYMSTPKDLKLVVNGDVINVLTIDLVKTNLINLDDDRLNVDHIIADVNGCIRTYVKDSMEHPNNTQAVTYVDMILEIYSNLKIVNNVANDISTHGKINLY